MISTSNLTIQFGAKPLFENISTKFGGGNRYGLIGANGSGKSTFMKILAGDLAPTHGSVSSSPGERIGVLKQDQFAFEEYSVIDAVIMGHAELWEVKQERDRIYALPEMSEDDGMRAGDLEGKYAELDGYSAEARAGELLSGVDIPPEQHYGPMSEIAPGFKLRVLLAQALFSDPDILLLDEPTNNLDINTIRWLEEVLEQRNCTIIVISHDRHFLNSVCDHMADLDYGTLKVFPGNYDEYMLAATQARASQIANNERKKTQVDQLKAFVARFSANASKSKQATSRARQIDKIKIEDIKPSSRKNPYIRFDFDEKLHRRAVHVKDLRGGYDEDLFNELSFDIEAGEKVAIIGPNGIGKTTLLKMLMGDMEIRDGVVKWPDNARIGYFAQDHATDFDNNKQLMEWLADYRQPSDDEQVLRSQLGRLLFSGDDMNKRCKVLSGGEQARMMFARISMQRNNILLLDEPTNHLDMESIESLNMALDDYKGTLIFVSHDRAFVSSLATRVIELSADGVANYVGGYDDYLHAQGVE
ncbi:MAG: ABC-F family ATPase [Gammaproteobacteria bacterium]|nr:MAG: ABC-F family ATPase [Gammaproteobacteria bacterium]